MENIPQLSTPFSSDDYYSYLNYEKYSSDKTQYEATQLIKNILQYNCVGIVVNDSSLNNTFLYSKSNHLLIKERILYDSLRIHIMDYPIILLSYLYDKSITDFTIYIDSWCFR